MWNDRTLAADIEYAAELVVEGLASLEQASLACGIPLDALKAHLAAGRPAQAQQAPSAPDQELLKGSTGAAGRHTRERSSAEEQTQSDAREGDAESGTTDYFVFYREENRWLWKRVDSNGCIVKSSERRFPLYLDCVADARPHGFTGRPLFIFAAGDIAALNAPDKLS
jgi:hypothetical protein